MNKFSSFVVAGMLGALLLVGCGSGSSGGSAAAGPAPTNVIPAPDPGSGSGGSAASGGVGKTSCIWAQQGIEGTGRYRRKGIVESVDSDGSVVVDGVRYTTREASIVVNGACAHIDQLGVGRVVDVVAIGEETSHDGIADAIFSDDDVAGMVTNVNPAEALFVVMGQYVRTNSGTVYADSIQPAALSALVAGDHVSVSGLLGDDGYLIATRIERRPYNANALAAGIVSDLDHDSKEFHLNTIRVAFDDARLQDFPAAGIQNGDRVRVQGRYGNDGNGVHGYLVAQAIQHVDHSSDTPSVVLEGPMTLWNDPDHFHVGDQPVVAGTETMHVGVPFGSLGGVPNLYWVTVVGPVDDLGVVHAQVVVKSAFFQLNLQGPITDIDAPRRRVSIAGVPVCVDSDTAVRQADEAGGRSISFDDLNVGNQLLLLGETLRSRGCAKAYRLVQAAPSQHVSVRQRRIAFDYDSPVFELSIGPGVLPVETSSNTVIYSGFRESILGTTPAEEFWHLADIPAAQLIVDVFGTWTGDRVLADEIYWDWL